MTSALQRQRNEVLQSHGCASVIDLAGGGLSPQRRTDLEIDQFWSDEALAAQPRSRYIAIGAVVGQSDDENAGINDEHDHPGSPRQRP